MQPHGELLYAGHKPMSSGRELAIQVFLSRLQIDVDGERRLAFPSLRI